MQACDWLMSKFTDCLVPREYMPIDVHIEIFILLVFPHITYIPLVPRVVSLSVEHLIVVLYCKLMLTFIPVLIKQVNSVWYEFF